MSFIETGVLITLKVIWFVLFGKACSFPLFRILFSPLTRIRLGFSVNISSAKLLNDGKSS
jgi:hypothetical protein